MEAVGALVFLAVTVLLFLLFKAVVLWYWRVNEAVTLLHSINEKLGRLAGPRPYDYPCMFYRRARRSSLCCPSS